MNRLAISALLIAGLGGAARGEDANRATAERYFRAGARAYAAQNFAAAAQDFDEAYRAVEMPEIAFSAAQAYRRLYRVDPKPEYVRRAVELYRAYLAKVKSGGRVGDAADSLGEMEREAQRLGVSLSGGSQVALGDHTRLGITVTIADQKGDATLGEITDTAGDVTKGIHATLDGKPVEPFALIDVEPKEHVLAVSADGYLPVEKRAVAVAGQSQLIEVELKPKAGKLAVRTEDDARISVDGRAVAAGPAATVEIPAGKHLISIVRAGRVGFARELVVTRGQELAVDAPLAKTARRRAVPWLWGGAAVLAAGAVATGIIASVEDSHASTILSRLGAGNRPPSDADAYDDDVRSRDHFVTATWILGGAAVAAGTIGLGLYLFDHGDDEALRITPIAGGGAGGAALAGRF